MAFTVANLVNVYSGPPGFGVYVYKSDTDDRELVMASGYFNNADDDQVLTADDIIHVIGDEGGYTLRVDTVSSGVVTTELGAGSGPVWLQVDMTSIAATTSSWVVSPCDGKIRRMKGVMWGSADVDTTFGLELATVNVMDGDSEAILTLTASGSAAGDVIEGEADTANTVSEGSAIEVTCGGEGTTASRATLLIEVLPN